MGRSMSLAANHLTKVTGNVRIHSEKLRREFSVFAENGQLKQREEGEGFRSEHALAWAIGSGANGLSFILQRGAFLFQAPLSYYSRVGRWDLSPGYEFADYGFNRPIAAGCIHCHSGRPQPVAQTNGQYRNPPFQELAIGCENCHGPGQKHIAQQGARSSIINPARLPPSRADEICMNCHQAGDARVLQPGKTENDYRPGQPLNDTLAIFQIPRSLDNSRDADLLEHHESMRLSRCFQESGTMSCQSCHNPHSAKVDYRAKCMSCHEQKFGGAGFGTGHPERSSDCTSCHMPKREVQLIAHAALTNHRIVRRPGQPLPPLSGRADELAHLNPAGRTPLPLLTRMQAYSQLAERLPAYYKTFHLLLDEAAVKEPTHPLVLATLGRRALRAKQLPEAIKYLESAREHGSSTATTLEDLAEAYGQSGRLEESAQVLLEGIRTAPFTQVLHKALALRYIQLKRYDQAKEALARYVELFPEDDFVRRLLTQVSGPR